MMSAAELESFILKKNAGRDAWDGDVSGKTVADVDVTVLSDYIDRANRAGRIDFPYTNNDEVLNKLGVIEGGKLKNAADATIEMIPSLSSAVVFLNSSFSLSFPIFIGYSNSVIVVILAVFAPVFARPCELVSSRPPG
jgi:hypothetical protein